jgi:hypothetical protein
MSTVEEREYEHRSRHRGGLVEDSRAGGTMGLDLAALAVVALLIWGPLLMGALRSL